MLNGNEQLETATAVKKTLTVACAQQAAFSIFTSSMGNWWPATHHIGSTPFRDIVVEPKTGGRWYEIDEQNEQCQWGHVLAWEPPFRLLLSWHLGPDWKYNPDLSSASEVEVRFVPESSSTTRIELTHRSLERHGAGFEKLRDDIDSPGGWTSLLAEYRKFIEERAAGELRQQGNGR